MKKLILILCISMLLVGCTTTAPTNNVSSTDVSNVSSNSTTTTPEKTYTEVRVSTAKDLFQNIKPYTRIILTEDFYNLSKVDPFELENVETDDWFIGNEYTIHDVDHFEICAEKNQLVKMVVESGHVNVFNFKDCHDVKLEGLVLGHDVEKGTCFGGVIHTEDCSDFVINNCHLYGCGTYGIIANDTSNVTVTNSEIYDCTEGLIQLVGCKNYVFENTYFMDSEEYSMLVLNQCDNIAFNNCVVAGNLSKDYCSLFSTSDSKNISITGCLFRNNTYPAFGDKEEYTITGCLIEDDNFDEPVYYDIEPDFYDVEYGYEEGLEY